MISMLTILNMPMMRFFNRGIWRDRFNDRGFWRNYWNNMQGGHIWPIIIGSIVCLAIVVGLIILITALVRGSRHRKQGKGGQAAGAAGTAGTAGYVHGTETSAMRILDERYARGEIDEEEYLKRKESLRKG
jgi:putative membrane protein